MFLWLTTILIPCMAYMDRNRGTTVTVIPKIVANIILGLCAGILVEPSTMVESLAVAAAVALSYNVYGWGQPIGAIVGTTIPNPKFQGWQFGILKTNPVLALVFLGFLFGLTTFMFILIVAAVGHAIRAGAIVGTAYAIAFPLAPYTARHVFGIQCTTANPQGGWALGEVLRGGMAGFFLFTIGRAL